jgi:cellulose synthase/poly-beta-1,6-N-acetylglucosamine synthase-like glycosyltransferase
MMVLQALTLLFLLLYAGLLHFYKKWWNSLYEYEEEENPNTTFLTVVIPARNEAERLPALLNAIKEQSYPRDSFEVLVVDDYSADGTAAVASAAGLTNLTLLMPSVPAARSSKKRAIETAVQQAKGELIITTDADCLPGPNWLSTLNSFYKETGAAFIAAPVRFSYKPRFLERFQALDFLTLQGITGASVAAHFSSMCNGANLAYTREAFERVKGFEGIDKVATGDDMLLMHKIWKAYPGRVFYLKSREAIVNTPPMPTWRDFISQRRRWASKTLVYEDWKIIAVLGFVYLLNVLPLVLLTAGFWNTGHLLNALLFLLVKTLLELSFLYPVAKFFREEKLLRYFIFFQPVHVVYTVSVGLLSQLGKYEWKGRRTR